MASFSELANLSADVVAKVEDSKEARPAWQLRTYRAQTLVYRPRTLVYSCIPARAVYALC